MKAFILIPIIVLSYLYSISSVAKSTQYDVTILPLLFHAQAKGYVAKSPWFSLSYRDQQVELASCAASSCQQAIVFTHFKQINVERPAQQQLLVGKPGRLTNKEAYTSLSLGDYQAAQLLMSGNQRRVLFSLNLSEQLRSLDFQFNDAMVTRVQEDGRVLVRKFNDCQAHCEYRWQAFSINQQGQYQAAHFSRNSNGRWQIIAADDAVKLELTSLIGEYQQSRLVEIDQHGQKYVQDMAQRQQQVDILTDNIQLRLQLQRARVIAFVDDWLLVKYKRQLLMMDLAGNIIEQTSQFKACSKQLISSRYINQRLYLVCARKGRLQARASRVPILVQYPTEHLSDMSSVYLLELTPNFELVAATEFEFPVAQLNQLQIKPWRWGIWLGVGEAYKSTVYHSYQMNKTAAEIATCPNINDGYGYGLLCWKALNNPSLTYTPNMAAANIPTFVVDNTTPQLLNQLEDNQHGLIFSSAGSAVDPNGVWTHPNNAATSRQHLALASAIYHYRWGSPVAANIIYPAASPSQPVMFREVKYAAANSANLPHNICNEFSSSSTYPEYQAADTCMSQADFGLFSLESLVFDRWLAGSYSASATVNGSDLYWFPWYTNYVGDPPITELFADEVINEMSARLMPNAAQVGHLTQDTYVNGTRVSQAIVAGFYVMDY